MMAMLRFANCLPAVGANMCSGPSVRNVEKRGAGTGFFGGGRLGRDIMTLCIMSKCGGGYVREGDLVTVLDRAF